MANCIPKIEYDVTPIVIQFTKPPQGDYLNLVIDSMESTSKSFSGKSQTTWAYNKTLIEPKFFLVEQAIKDLVQTFFINWGAKGLSFKYFPHSDEVTFYNVTISNKKFSPKSLTPVGVNQFVWEFEISMEVDN